MDYMGACFYVFPEEIFASIRKLAINSFQKKKPFHPAQAVNTSRNFLIAAMVINRAAVLAIY